MATRLMIIGAVLTALIEPAAAVQSPPLDPITARWTGDFGDMVARRRIRILTPYSRSHYYFDQGVPRGIIHDASVRFERAINLRLKTTAATQVHVVVVPTPRADLLRALADGRGDVVATNLVVTPERSTVVDFAIGRTGVRHIVVTDRRIAPLGDAADLSGRDVTVRDDSVELVELRQLNVTLRDHGKPLIRITTVPASIDDEELLEMVDRGLVGATVVDDFVASFWSRTFRGLRLHARAVVRDNVRIGWAVRRGSGGLAEEIAKFLRSDGPSTRLGNAALIRTQLDAQRLYHATRGADFHRFTALVALFRKYSDRYDLDYRMTIAQAYQESRLRQDARSAAGAIGIMQVLPDTARAMAVDGIDQAEPNIHAGVKYLRWIIDRHIHEGTVDDVNRTLFAFAAYNCGPARLQQLRTEARRRGLNPDRWFGHVEAVAAEHVGSETVRYVSNIYKYYVAYSLAVAQSPLTH